MFTDNVGEPNTRGVISRDYIKEPDCGELSQERGNIVYENCYFEENVGEVSLCNSLEAQLVPTSVHLI